MKFREIELPSGTIAFMGKNAENNDELMKKFKGLDNVILHTVAPGSPFCVIGELRPGKKDIAFAATACAFYSQDWRENRKDTKVNIFTGKDLGWKWKWMKPGIWKVKKK